MEEGSQGVLCESSGDKLGVTGFEPMTKAKCPSKVAIPIN